MNAANLSFTYTKEQVIKAYKQFVIHRFKTKGLFILGISMIPIVISLPLGPEFIFQAVGSIVLMLILLPPALYFILPMVYFSKETDYLDSFNIQINEDSIKVESRSKSFTYQWHSFKSFVVTPDFILLLDKKEPVVILPKQILAQQNTDEDLIRNMHLRISEANKKH